MSNLLNSYVVGAVADAAAAAVAPVAPSTALATPAPRTISPLKMTSEEQKALATEAGVGLAGGVVGAVLWKKHRYLGFFGGATLADAAYRIRKPEQRTQALVDVAGEAGCVGGSLYWKKHPVWGYILGGLASSVALKLATGKTPFDHKGA